MEPSERLRSLTAGLRLAGRRPRPSSLIETAVTASKAGLAAGAAYALAQLITGETVPVFAPLAALLAVAASVRSSLRETVPRVVALFLGAALAVLAGVLVGLTFWSVAALSLASVLVARLLQLPAAAASQVPLTALLLVALAGGELEAAELRVVDGLIGLVVGVLVNALVVPPLRLRPAVQAAERVTEALADLLADLAVGLPEPGRAQQAREWLVRARELSEPVDAFARAVAEAEDAHRWNPRGRGTARRVQRLAAASLAYAHVETQVRGATRTLADAALDGVLRTTSDDPDDRVFPPGYARICASCGDAVQAFGDLVADDCTLGSEPGRRLLDAVAAAAEARSALVEDVLTRQLRREDLLLHGALLSDLRRIVREVDPERGEHRDAVRPPGDDGDDGASAEPPSPPPTAGRQAAPGSRTT